MRRFAALAFSLPIAFVGALIACSSSSSDPGGAVPTDGGPVEGGNTLDGTVPSEFLPYVDALCDYISRCEPEQGKGFESAEACKVHWTQLGQCQTDLKKVSAADIDACTSYLGTLGCDKGLTAPGTPCSAVFQGGPVSKQGERCQKGHLCELGNYCPNPEPATCSTCIKQVGIGASCTYGFECESEYCNAGHCAEKVAAGQACAAGAPCAGYHVCVSGTCVALKTIGESCSDASECVVGALCVASKCARLSACGRTKDQHCDTTADCAKNLYCHGPDFTCQPRVAISASCVEGIEACVDGAFCNLNPPGDAGGDPVCMAFPGLNEPCPDGYCGPGAFCNSVPTCEPLHPDGIACTNYWECLSGACNGGKCGC